MSPKVQAVTNKIRGFLPPKEVIAKYLYENNYPEGDKIRKTSDDSSCYFVYYWDGQIEHRDTYSIVGNQVSLYYCEKRYHDSNKWIEET